jgi:hypothetical protein
LTHFCLYFEMEEVFNIRVNILILFSIIFTREK